MYLIIPAKDYPERWVCFTLTDSTGKVLFVDIVRFKNLTALDDAPFAELPDEVYLTVVDHDTDRMKLANRMVPKYQWRVAEILKSWSHGNKRHGKPVLCVDTGETFSSVMACARAHGISYSQLSNHLKGAVGYKTVKGKVYKNA